MHTEFTIISCWAFSGIHLHSRQAGEVECPQGEVGWGDDVPTPVKSLSHQLWVCTR